MTCPHTDGALLQRRLPRIPVYEGLRGTGYPPQVVPSFDFVTTMSDFSLRVSFSLVVMRLSVIPESPQQHYAAAAVGGSAGLAHRAAWMGVRIEHTEIPGRIDELRFTDAGTVRSCDS